MLTLKLRNSLFVDEIDKNVRVYVCVCGWVMGVVCRCNLLQKSFSTLPWHSVDCTTAATIASRSYLFIYLYMFRVCLINVIVNHPDNRICFNFNKVNEVFFVSSYIVITFAVLPLRAERVCIQCFNLIHFQLISICSASLHSTNQSITFSLIVWNDVTFSFHSSIRIEKPNQTRNCTSPAIVIITHVHTNKWK